MKKFFQMIARSIAQFVVYCYRSIVEALKDDKKVGLPNTSAPGEIPNGNLVHAKMTNEMLIAALETYQETSDNLVKMLLKIIDDLNSDRDKEERRYEKEIREIKVSLKECKEECKDQHEKRDRLEEEKEAKRDRDYDKMVAHFEGEITRMKEFIMKNSTNTGETIQGMG